MEFILIWLVLAAIAGLIASAKGRSGIGFFVYGLMIPIVAIIHAAVMAVSPAGAVEEKKAVAAAEGRRPCPHCAEMILPNANVCRYCGRDVEVVTTPKVEITKDGTLRPSGQHARKEPTFQGTSGRTS